MEIARRLVVFLKRPGGQAQFSSALSAQTADRDDLGETLAWIAERLRMGTKTHLLHLLYMLHLLSRYLYYLFQFLNLFLILNLPLILCHQVYLQHPSHR